MARHEPAQASPLEELSAHIAQLMKAERELLAEQLSLEQHGAVPELPLPGETVAGRLKFWLNGYAHPLAGVGMSGNERLRNICVDKDAIRLALSQLEQQRQQLVADEHRAIAERDTAAWLADCRALVLAADRLRALDEKVQARRNQAGGQYLPLIVDFGQRSVIGARWDADPSSRARTALLQAGIISEKDLEAARNV